MLRKLYSFFRSVKLASILISWLLLTVVIRGVMQSCSPAGTALLDWPLLILIPLFLFSINLLVCGVSRVVLLMRSGAYFSVPGLLRLGPDLVHLAILLFLIGGLLSHYGRVEGEVSLRPGDTAMLNRRYSLELVDFRIEYYPEGYVRSYISEVRLRRDGEAMGEVFPIMVNHPLSIGRLKIYQSSYEGTGGGGASILQAVYDPGFPAILWGAVFAVTGLLLIGAARLLRYFKNSRGDRQC